MNDSGIIEDQPILCALLAPICLGGLTVSICYCFYILGMTTYQWLINAGYYSILIEILEATAFLWIVGIIVMALLLVVLSQESWTKR